VGEWIATSNSLKFFEISKDSQAVEELNWKNWELGSNFLLKCHLNEKKKKKVVVVVVVVVECDNRDLLEKSLE
jgi:hypothetical protein